MFDLSFFILLALAALSGFSHNLTVALAILFLLVLRVIPPLHQAFPWIEKQGVTVGIIILTIGVMSPLASGSLAGNTLMQSFLHWKSLLAIAMGIFVSWAGGRGVTLMSKQPALAGGLLIGTVIGVSLFRGVPVGPLIAAGLLSLIAGAGK